MKVRKGHLATIEKSKSLGFSSTQIRTITSSDDLTLDSLNTLVSIFSKINKEYSKQAETFTDVFLTLIGLFNDGWKKRLALCNFYSKVLPQNPSMEELKHFIQITKRYLQEGIFIYEIVSNWDVLFFMYRENYPKFCMDYIAKTEFNVSLSNFSEPNNYLLETLKSVLGDEFKNNQKNSFLYWFWSNDPNPLSTYYARNKFNIIYDLNTHTFIVDPRKFYQKEVRQDVIGQDKLVFVLNRDKLRNLYFCRFPLFSNIHDYVMQNYTHTSEEKENRYQKVFYYESDLEKKLIKVHESLQTSFEVDKKFDKIEVDIAISGYSYIKILSGNKIKVFQEKTDVYMTHIASVSVDIMVTPDEGIFIKKGKEHSRPMTVYEFYEFYEKHTSGLHDFFEMLLLHYTNRSLLLKDILSDIHINPNVRIPFVLNNVIQYYNKRQFITETFVTARQIPIKWNKRNIILSWLIIHSWNMVSNDKSRRILMQCKDNEILNGLSGSIRSGICNKFLASVIINRIQNIILAEQKRWNEQQAKQRIQNKDDLVLISSGILDEEMNEYMGNNVTYEDVLNDFKVIADDYVAMCRRPLHPNNKRSSKGKVNLDIKSYAQLNNRHDHFTQDRTDYNKVTGSVNVPKDSQFNELRTYLPEDFEWITNRKRLIMETELQHHCVWSYAEKISKDDCAIYSYVDQKAEFGDLPKRYTIEFQCNKEGKYYVAQVQGRYNKVNANNMRQHMQKLLDKYQK